MARRWKRVQKVRKRTKAYDYYVTRTVRRLPVIPIDVIRRKEVRKRRLDRKKTYSEDVYYKFRKPGKVVKRILPTCQEARRNVRRKYFEIDGKMKKAGAGGVDRKNKWHRNKLTRSLCR